MHNQSKIFISLFVAQFALSLEFFSSPAFASLSSEEGKDIVIAKVHHTQPDIVQNTAESLGTMRYCPGVSASDYITFKKNSLNWIKLGATEFEAMNGEPGFLNMRFYRKLKSIFDEGLSRGERNAKMFRNKIAYKRDICPELLDDESLSGPSSRLMRLIIEK